MSDPVLQALSDILSRLGRVEGELTAVRVEVSEVKTTGEATHEQACKTNGRVTKLEQAKSYAAGAQAAMTWVPKLAFALVVSLASGGIGAAIAALVGG